MYLTQSLHRAAQQTPDRLATSFAGRLTTYGSQIDRVARLAGALRSLGMVAGDRVGILALNSDRYVEYQFAVAWGGGVLNLCNTRWSSREIAFALSDSETKFLLFDEAFVPLVAELSAGLGCLSDTIYIGEGACPPGSLRYEDLIGAAQRAEDVLRRERDLAAIFYTGGTTGSAKGVMLSHQNLISSALGLAAEGVIPRGGVFLDAAPMFHIAAFGVGLAHHLLGNTHAVIPGFTAEAMAQCVQTDRVTDVVLVPTMVQMLADHLEQVQDRYDLTSLRRVIYGASAATEAVLSRAQAVLPDVAFMQAYGMTEMAPIITINATREGNLRKPLSCGQPTAGTEVKIVDSEDREVSRHTVGEIVVRGPNMMLGYWNRPSETEAAMRGGWMHTGDGGQMDKEGFVFIVDRLKDMIISGGENIYSAEVENALASHPAVASCAVIAVPCEQWGEAVHAVVVLRDGNLSDADDLRAHCQARIARYKCPRSFEFRTELPSSSTGKILKSVLREPFWTESARRVS